MATKRKQFAKWSRDANVPQVTYSDNVTGTFKFDSLSDGMKHQLMWYGLKQKLADSGSDADTVVEFRTAVNATWSALMNDEFNRQGGGSGKASVETVAEAIARIKGGDASGYEQKLRADETLLDKMRQHAGVKAKIAEIYAERMAAKAESAENLDI